MDGREAGQHLAFMLRADTELLLGLWQCSLSATEHWFSQHARVQRAGLEGNSGVLGFSGDFPGSCVCWRFSLGLLDCGFGAVAAQLALDLSQPLGEPDGEGIRWIGQG